MIGEILVIALSASAFIGAALVHNQDKILAWIVAAGGCGFMLTAGGMLEDSDSVISLGMLTLLLCAVALLLRAQEWQRKQSK